MSYEFTPKQEEAYDALLESGGDEDWVEAEDLGHHRTLDALEKKRVIQTVENSDGVKYAALHGLVLESPPEETSPVSEKKSSIDKIRAGRKKKKDGSQSESSAPATEPTDDFETFIREDMEWSSIQKVASSMKDQLNDQPEGWGKADLVEYLAAHPGDARRIYKEINE